MLGSSVEAGTRTVFSSLAGDVFNPIVDNISLPQPLWLSAPNLCAYFPINPLFFSPPPFSRAATMRLSSTFASSLLLVAAGVAQAASSWSFDEASITVAAKGSSATVQEK